MKPVLRLVLDTIMQLKVIGILLVYYPKYKKNSIKRFNEILRQISSRNFKMIVINNNPEEIENKSINEIVIDGLNKKSEFYGWDLGLSYAKKCGLVDQHTTVVLANDTFCEHRYFSKFDQLLFARGVKKIKDDDRPVLLGELCGLKQSYEIMGMKSKGWISTYLFAINYQFIKCLDSLVLDDRRENSWVYKVRNGSILWSDRISSNLAMHISNWLSSKWYNRGALNNNEDLLIWKVHSILNEKYLSAICLRYGGCLRDPFKEILSIYFSLKLYKRLIRIFGKVCRTNRLAR